MTAFLLPNAKQQFFDTNGRPLAGGSVYFYIPNTSTFKNTWQDAGETILNTNPVVLDSNGQAIIYGDGQYRQVVYDVHGNLIWDKLTDSPVSSSALSSTIGAGGAANIGFDGNTLAQQFASRVNRVVDSIGALRALNKLVYTRAYVFGYYAAGDGGGGAYYMDANDTTSSDNGGTIIVANDGGRWKLQPGGLVSPRTFGAKGDGTTDDTDALNRWALYLLGGNVAANQHMGYGCAGTYKVTGAGWQIGIGDYMPNLITDGADQFCITGTVSPLVTIFATGGSGQLPTVTWSGIRLNGVTNTGTNEGVRVAGACFFTGHGWHFDNLGIGIRYYNLAAGSFTEGVVFEDALFNRSVTTWVRYSVGAGDGSFRNSGLRNFKGNLGETAGPAILIDSGCVPYFAPMSGTIWNYNADGIFIRNNSTQVPLIGDIDTETQGSNTNKLTLADNAGTGQTFLKGSVGVWNYGSPNIHLGKLIENANYFNANTGEGQMFQADAMSGQIVSTALGQQFKVPIVPGVTKPFQQWSAILTVCVTYTNGYYWQGMYTVLPGATDAIINCNALPGGGLVNNTGTFGPVTNSQGNDGTAWFDNGLLPAGSKLSYTVKYQYGLIPQ
jgi:hypothetical protein